MTKDIVEKLTAIKKVEQTDHENIAEVQKVDKQYLKYVKISFAALVVSIVAIFIGIVIVGLGINSSKVRSTDTSTLADLFDENVLYFDKTLKAAAIDIKNHRTLTENEIVVEKIQSGLNSTKEYSIILSDVKSRSSNIATYANLLNAQEFADQDQKFKVYYDDFRASFYDYGCPTDKCLSGNANTADSIEICMINCYNGKVYGNDAVFGFTYQHINDTLGRCWCNNKLIKVIRMYDLVNSFYYRYI